MQQKPQFQTITHHQPYSLRDLNRQLMMRYAFIYVMICIYFHHSDVQYTELLSSTEFEREFSPRASFLFLCLETSHRCYYLFLFGFFRVCSYILQMQSLILIYRSTSIRTAIVYELLEAILPRAAHHASSSPYIASMASSITTLVSRLKLDKRKVFLPGVDSQI